MYNPKQTLSRCIEQVSEWMSCLQLNKDKTEIIDFGTKREDNSLCSASICDVDNDEPSHKSWCSRGVRPKVQQPETCLCIYLQQTRLL